MVYGCDINPQTVEKINQKILPFNEPEMEALLKKSTMQASLNPVPSDVFLICVPTPFDKEIKMADLGFVKKALETIVEVLEKGNLIIIESTITPGTSEKLAVPIIEKTGLKVGKNIFLAALVPNVPSRGRRYMRWLTTTVLSGVLTKSLQNLLNGSIGLLSRGSCL